MKINCKYCKKILNNEIRYIQSNTNQYNCESCEVMCRIAVDMISQSVHHIGEEENIQPDNSIFRILKV